MVAFSAIESLSNARCCSEFHVIPINFAEITHGVATYIISMNKKITVLMMALLLTGSLSGCLGNGDKGDDDETDTVPVYEPTPEPDSDHLVNADDYNVLYIGHSFGRLFAQTLEDYAHIAGETDHAQYIEFSGGVSGTPGLLWDDAQHQANITAFLDTGEIDVLIMICCSPEFIQTLDTDQAVWNFTDYAVAKNPNIRIGLAMPWKDYPGEYENASEYATNSTLDLYPYWGNLSDELRADYPGTDVFTFHHGALAYEMREMFEAGDLDGDIQRLQGPEATSLFTDAKGHAGNMLVDTGTLIWLHAVHGIDPMDMPEFTQWETDIRVIAKTVLEE